MIQMRLETVCILVVAAAAVLATRCASEAAADERQQKLIEVLLSDAPKAEKAITCKRLTLCGDKDAVPALAALLADEELASWALIPLEAIPGPEADAALRDAAGKLKGRLLIGVINSISVRGDAEAVGLLAERLKDADAGVASAAAAALGNIGGAAATKALDQSLGSAPPVVRSTVAEGLILCAEDALEAGNSAEAVRLYDLVRKANVHEQRIVEATRGAVLARGEAGLPLLVEQLQSKNREMFYVGLRIAREMGGPEVAKALIAELAKLQSGDAASPREAPLIYALGDLGQSAASPVVLEAAKSGSPSARAAAVRVLGAVGDASAVPVLLKAAEESGDLGKAALESLEKLKGDGVDEAIAAGLGDATGPTRVVLIQLVGFRGIESAVDQLLTAADGDDAQLRAAAIGALGMTIAFDKLDVLIERLLKPRDADDAKAVKIALMSACTRMPDRDATAEKLLAEVSGASPENKVALMELVTAVGGKTALAGLAAAARSNDDAMRDLGSRLLGEWIGPDAAPVLLDLAKTSKEDKYKVRALRGYLRIARQFEVPLAERITMCQEALKVAQRVEERKLAMEVLRRHPTAKGLALAADGVRDPKLRANAGVAAVEIAEKILQSDPAAVAAAMKPVVDAGGDPKVTNRAKQLLDQATKMVEQKK